MLPEKSLTRPDRLIFLPNVLTIMCAVVLATWYVYREVADADVLALWWIGNSTLIACVYAFFRADRSPWPRPMATGRMVAVVVAREQGTYDLNACIWSILNQRSVIVDEVHVVDDGSIHQPVQPFTHPRVRWHRTEDNGAYAALRYVLDRLEPGDWDFVVTVGGGYILDERALGHQLGALARPVVAAATANVVFRNAGTNPVTRVADLNLGTACALGRALGSPAAAFTLVPGTPVVYRAHVPFRHRSGDLAADADSDDRRLLVSAALDGRVVGVSEAVAWASAPEDLASAYRRWRYCATSWWRMIPPALAGADRLRGLMVILWVLAQVVLAPLTIGYSLVVILAGAWRGAVPWTASLVYLALYLAVRYAATGVYLIERPAESRWRRFFIWLVMTPVEAVFAWTVVVPTKYLALLKPRRNGGASLRERAAGRFLSATVSPGGTVYRSAHRTDGRFE